MFCQNCGAQIGDNDKFCKACGTPVQAQPVAPVTQQAPVNQQPAQQVTTVQPSAEKNSISDEEKARRKKRGTILGIISIAMLFGTLAIVIPLSVTRVLDDYPVFGITLGFISAAAIIVAYVLMVISLAKYRSTLSKVMIWIYGVILVITLIVGIFMMYTTAVDCSNGCVDCVHHF